MNINEICNKIRDEPEYNFLRDNPHLGSNIILLGLGGSYAYGTNIAMYELGEEPTENDLVFYHDGRLARYMEAIENPWKR